MSIWTQPLAQVRAEVAMRLRSLSTLFALAVLIAGAYLWIPNPTGRATSISWSAPDGTIQAPIFDSAYVGTAIALMDGIMLSWLGFYLIAGSVRRDRDRRVGAVLAATPLSNAAYLGGKLLAHLAYLGVLVAASLGMALVAFLRYSPAPFQVIPFLTPTLLCAPTALLTVASFAVLFDVTPGLGGRGGLVLWFFTFMFLLIALPMQLGGGMGKGHAMRIPAYDPTGSATFQVLLRRSVPTAAGVSSGLNIRPEGVHIQRVPWSGVAVTPEVIAKRLMSVVAALSPFLLALVFFDRFDPARENARMRRRRGVPTPGEAGAALSAPPMPLDSPLAGSALPGLALGKASPPKPIAWRAILAEASLVFGEAKFLRIPLMVAALGAAAVPDAGRPIALGIFLLIAAPVISEVGAREELSGTSGLIFSQPAVPLSPVLWKASSLLLFLAVASAPAWARLAWASPARAFSFLIGLAFASALAATTGRLAGGGRLFTALYLLMWYASMNRVPFLDFAGLFANGALAPAGAWLGAASAVFGLGLLGERVRRL